MWVKIFWFLAFVFFLWNCSLFIIRYMSTKFCSGLVKILLYWAGCLPNVATSNVYLYLNMQPPEFPESLRKFVKEVGSINSSIFVLCCYIFFTQLTVFVADTVLLLMSLLLNKETISAKNVLSSQATFHS